MENDKSAQGKTTQANLDKLTEAVNAAAAKGGIANLAAAYVAAREAIGTGVVKNANNPHFKNNYADLSAVLEATSPHFAANGLALLQSPGEMVAGPNGELQISLTWMLLHKSGENLQGKMTLPIGPKPTAQGAGSALTYARRYQGASIGGIAQVDDDGQEASAPAPKGKKSGPTKAPEDGPGADEYAARQNDLIARIDACKSGEQYAAIRKEVQSFGDETVVNHYVKATAEFRKQAAKEAN